MQKFMDWMERYIVPIAAKIGGQRHLVAIRDGFASIMPLMIAGSVGALLHTFPVKSIADNYFAADKPLHWVDTFGLNLWGASMFMMGIFVSVSVAYALAKSYDCDGLSAGLVSMCASLLFNNIWDNGAPITNTGTHLSWFGWEPGIFTKWLGASGLIVILITALVTTTIFCKFQKNEKLIIKLPEGVPPAVSKSFAALLPAMFTLFIVSAFFTICKHNGYGDIYGSVYFAIQKPLLGFADSLGVLLLLILIQQILWFFGLHGSNILAPVINAIFLALTAENMAAVAAGNTEGIHIINSQFLDTYVNLGGSGMTIALMIALIMKSNSSLHKSIRNVATAPAFFNINEPIIFGLPIVLNPIYIVPFILAPMASAIIAYTFSAVGFVKPASIMVPWTCPPVFSALLSTGQWQGALVSIICIAVAFLIYLPFVAFGDKRELDLEKQTAQGNTVNM